MAYWLGVDQFNGIVATLVVLGSAGAAAILVFTSGNILSAVVFTAAILIVTLTMYRVNWGFNIFVGLVLTLDHYRIPNFEPVTFKTGYFLNLKEIPYLPTLAAGVMNPLELHLLLLIAVWCVVLVVRRDHNLNRVHVWGAALVFFVGLVCSFVYGMRTGGDFLPAVWEVRALFYFGAMYFLVPQIIQTKEHVQSLLWVIIAAISFKALQGVARFVNLGLSFHGIPTLTNHEDPLFMLTLVIFLLALVMFNAQTRQRSALVMLLLLLVLGFFTGQRRAAYAAIVPSLATFVILLPTKQRWMLAKNSVPVLGAFALYAAVFWNSESRLASPVRLVKSGLGSDRETAGERYYSNLYRDKEKYNLAITVQESPVIGIGFGKKYEEPLKLVYVPFPLWAYIPHNEILWVIVKTGAVGFFLFWFFLNSFACRGVFVLSRMKDPYLQSVCALAISAVAGQVVVSYFDLQLTYYRNMVYLGTLMGLMSTAESIDQQSLQT